MSTFYRIHQIGQVYYPQFARGTTDTWHYFTVNGTIARYSIRSQAVRFLNSKAAKNRNRH